MDRSRLEQLVDVQVNALDPDGGLHRVRVLPVSLACPAWVRVSPRPGLAGLFGRLVRPPRKRYQQCPPPRRAVSAVLGRGTVDTRPRGRWGQEVGGSVLLTNHVLSGALIGALARRPVPAFAAGVASHFVLDAVPHWGDWGSQRRFMQVAVPDGLVSLAVMGALTAASPPGRRAAVLAGMAGAALPDVDKPDQRVVRLLALPGGRGPFSRAHPGRVVRPRPGRAGGGRAVRHRRARRRSAARRRRRPR